MRKKKYIFLLLSFLINAFVYCDKISVIIPCYYGHFQHLNELIDCLCNQTKLPDEVIISLSEYQKIPSKEIEAFQKKQYPFFLNVIKHKKKLYAGQNRNCACENASGDIFIIQDADDLPHPQRIEILTYLFSHYDIDHIMHRWVPDPKIYTELNFYWGSYILSDLKFYYLSNWDDLYNLDRIHFGNIAIRRNVFEKIKWSDIPRGQDMRFDIEVFEKIKKTLILDAYLVIFRELSSFDPLHQFYSKSSE